MSFNCYWKILNTPCRFNFYSQIDRHEVYPKPTLKTFIRLERSHWNIGIRSFQILSNELFYSGMIWTLAGCSLTFYLYMFHGSIVLHICISTALQFCISTALQLCISTALQFYSSVVRVLLFICSVVLQFHCSTVLQFCSYTALQYYSYSVLHFFSSTFSLLHCVICNSSVLQF